MLQKVRDRNTANRSSTAMNPRREELQAMCQAICHSRSQATHLASTDSAAS